jgi:hypothetical protein
LGDVGPVRVEAISPADINWWNTLGWARDADDTLAVYVRTATTSGGLASAAWRARRRTAVSIGAAANGGSPPGPRRRGASAAAVAAGARRCVGPLAGEFRPWLRAAGAEPDGELQRR